MGDIVQVFEGDELPCDILILASQKEKALTLTLTLALMAYLLSPNPIKARASSLESDDPVFDSQGPLFSKIVHIQP